MLFVPSQRVPPGQTLMIDADDTLWENNVLFDQAIASFVEFLDHKTHTPAEVRDHLNRIEHERVKVHGYGLAAFRESLVVCFEELAGIQATAEHRTEIDRFTAIIAGEDMLLLEGVRETLHHLYDRHRLLLVTKGADDEQRKKLRNSGLEQYFHGVEVLREKHIDAYCALHNRHACELERTWMIGNSPKSDINPALAAGLNAVYIPHPNTWVLEEEAVHPPAEGPRLVTLQRFSQLAELF